MFSIELGFDLRLTPNKVGSPILASWIALTLSKQGTSHIFHSSKPRQKFSHVKVNYMLNNYLFLCL
jgi:hypothetical protein